MTSTPSLRGDSETKQAPPGLLIATLISETTGMRIYSQDDWSLELWRDGSEHLATVTPVGDFGTIEWTEDGLEIEQYKRNFWESTIWPVFKEHRRTMS